MLLILIFNMFMLKDLEASSFICHNELNTEVFQVRVDKDMIHGKFCTFTSDALKVGEATSLIFNQDSRPDIQFDGVTQIRRVLFRANKWDLTTIFDRPFSASLTYVQNPYAPSWGDYDSGMKLSCTKTTEDKTKNCITPETESRPHPKDMSTFNAHVREIFRDEWEKPVWVTYISKSGEFLLAVFTNSGDGYLEIHDDSSIYTGPDDYAKVLLKQVQGWTIYPEYTNKEGLLKVKKLLEKK